MSVINVDCIGWIRFSHFVIEFVAQYVLPECMTVSFNLGGFYWCLLSVNIMAMSFILFYIIPSFITSMCYMSGICSLEALSFL